MRNDIKNKEPQERTKCIPAEATVIEFTGQEIICTSPGWDETETNPEQTVF